MGEEETELVSEVSQLTIEPKEYDAEIVEFSIKFKNIYENAFEEYLRGLSKGTPIYGSKLPSDEDKDDEDEVDSIAIFYFNRLEFDSQNKDKIQFVIVNSFDNSEEYKFYRVLCTKNGPYANTHLWSFNYFSGRDKDDNCFEHFLDLPASLYRLIE